MSITSNKSSTTVTFYDPKRLSLQQEPDGASFISLLLCSVGMFMRNKLLIWKKNGTGISQYFINAIMIIFGMVSLYVLVPPGMDNIPSK